MENNQTAAPALFAMTFSTALFVKLRQKEILSLQDGKDILEFGLLNLETHQKLAADHPEPVIIARQMFEQMINDLNVP